MCGRFTLFSEFDDIIEQFNIDQFLPEGEYHPSYNVAPSQNILTIINDGSNNRLGKLRWGLIPPWAKDEKIGYKMINARAETLSEKPSFRKPLVSKRCIIPADSFLNGNALIQRLRFLCGLSLNHPISLLLPDYMKSGTHHKAILCTLAQSSQQSLMSLWKTFMIGCQLSLLMRTKRNG
ncbi:putative SOS response associated peptidase; defective prophage 6 (fragment) [Bacillus vallismortis]